MRRDVGIGLLASKGWLATTPEAFRNALLQLARWKGYECGALITLGGDDQDDLIGVASGWVAMTSTVGPASTPAMHLVHGELWMGYGPILRGGGARNVTATARGEVWAAIFPGGRIKAMLATGELDWRPFVWLTMYYGDTTARIAADLLIRSSFLRCIAVILRFAGLHGNTPPPPGPIMVPVTQSELAGACNLSRNVIGTILRRLAAKGLVEVEYAGIRILDPAGLRHLWATGGDQ